MKSSLSVKHCPIRGRKHNRLSIVAIAILGALVINAGLALGGGFADNSGGVFPDDLGPTSIDVSHYSPQMQGYYRLFLSKCSTCHTIARAINSQFIGKKVWASYIVHKMMLKPGSTIQSSEGKKIFEFLVYDSKIRKTGANAKKWQKNRAQLLRQFKKRYPKDYLKLYGNFPLKSQDIKSEAGSSPQAPQ